LLLNVYICGYLLYCRYRGHKPSPWFYIPFVFIAIGWAVSIHTVTAFLYVGLGGRPFWNSSIVGPRFIASAFTAGPALIILAMQVVRRVTSSAPSSESARVGEDAAAHQIVPRPATMTDLELLGRHLPEMATVSPEARRTILAGASVLEVEAGDVLLHQGAIEKDAFFSLKGHVVVRREENGRFRITRSAGPGEQFGEISALGGTPRTATAIAEDSGQVLRLTPDALRLLMKPAPMNKVIRSRMSERLMITDRALMTLRSIVQVSMLINVFLLVNEIFKEFYSRTSHVASSQYLLLGLHGYHALVPWIWTAIGFNLIAMFLLVLPVSRSLKYLNIACVLAIVGIWIEKGMGLVVPGFIPSPLGEMIEYLPTVNETLVCLGIWAFGILCYTIFLRMAIPILQGRLSKANEGLPSLTAN
jgi:CRP-like cAMP-binding protein